MRAFITGSAGFIGFHLARRLLAEGHSVAGYDGMTQYYDVRLKQRRHALLEAKPEFSASIGMLEDRAKLEAAIGEFMPDVIVHLAAQAGVRYSLTNPETYIGGNLVGQFNLLEAARAAKPKHLVIASTSSVYGGNQSMPFREIDRADYPVSLYAATKKAGEAMSHSHAHLYDIPTTCFRFFTVYGPWGRPDMAIFRFVDAIERDEPIDVYGQGLMHRDFTYIDDLIEAVVRLADVIPETGKSVGDMDAISPVAPWRVVNIGGGAPIELGDFIAAIELALGKKARSNMMPMQPGDVAATWADPSLLRALTGYVPATRLEDGVRAFVDWHRSNR
jgi:UDP-glucuronate 4-epimerase